MDLEKRAACASQEQDRSAHQEGDDDDDDEDHDDHGFVDHIDGQKHQDGDDVECEGGQLQQLD